MIAGVALLACQDLPTAPQRISPESARSNDFLHDPQWGRSSSPSSGVWDATASTWDGSTPLGPAWNFPYKTIVVVNISGQVRQDDGALTGSGAVWGPLGITNVNGRNGQIGYRLAGTSGSQMIWPVKTTDTVAVQNEMRPVRAAVDGAQPNQYPNPNSCGTYNNQTPQWACYTYNGTAHLDFSRPHVDLTLTPSVADTGVNQDAPLTFAAGMNIASIKGIAVDMSQLQWRWIPDVPTADSTACASTSGTSCTIPVESSGTLYVTAYVNGEQQQKSVHVTANPRVPNPCSQIAELASRFPELANTFMDTIVNRLWRESKYSADTLNTDRRERGGYILYDSVTKKYSFQEFELSGQCHSGPLDTLHVPPTAVATIHTHPFRANDPYSGCGIDAPDGARDSTTGEWQKYWRAASDEDYDMLSWIEEETRHTPKGFILDFDGLITYQPSDRLPGSPTPNGDTKWGRCSYLQYSPFEQVTH